MNSHCDLYPIVKKIIKKKNSIMNVVHKNGTPFYAFDSAEVISSINHFKKAFYSEIPKIKIYYAIKTNHHEFLLNHIHRLGIGADVSSIRELKMAIQNGFTDIVYTGPGKTAGDLEYFLTESSTAILFIDSFSELETIGRLSTEKKILVTAGVRVTTKQQQSWSKFGIPLAKLKEFWKTASKYPLLRLQGIQFHNSWNPNAAPYRESIKDLSEYLSMYFDKHSLNQIKFVDFGGGFRPYLSEGRFSKPGSPDSYELTPSIPVEQYASEIGRAINDYIRPIIDCQFFTEPGRILSNSSMHIVLQVVDVKSPDVIIVDGGINIIGWERFEYDYFPIVNLTHPSETEIPCNVYGNLCMPQDQWGYSVFASRIEKGDILVVPYQGTLTYSLAQEFIYPIPPVLLLE